MVIYYILVESCRCYFDWLYYRCQFVATFDCSARGLRILTDAMYVTLRMTVTIAITNAQYDAEVIDRQVAI